jgi:WhiB family transcriptional regulator, redox-sensing transcriptional regulator
VRNPPLPSPLAKMIRPEWQQWAACRRSGVDGSIFFPDSADFEKLRAARAVCEGCAVRLECLQTALADTHLTGIWGGTSERERVRMRKGRGA